MVKHLSFATGGGIAALDATFGALSDATRRGILARLARGESSVSELAAPYEMSLPAVSKHLRVLEGAGLVVRHKDGRVHRCRLIAEPMKDAAEWIERYRVFWEEQFDALERYLAETGALTGPGKAGAKANPRLEIAEETRTERIELSDLKFETSKKAEGRATQEEQEISDSRFETSKKAKAERASRRKKREK
jgi:DNA-binding transcriptional ArsR family regulator